MKLQSNTHSFKNSIHFVSPAAYNCRQTPAAQNWYLVFTVFLRMMGLPAPVPGYSVNFAAVAWVGFTVLVPGYAMFEL
jgi:hypothetical protein